MWDHTVLPATRHKRTRPALTPARQTGTRFTYPGGMEGGRKGAALKPAQGQLNLVLPSPPLSERRRYCDTRHVSVRRVANAPHAALVSAAKVMRCIQCSLVGV